MGHEQSHQPRKLSLREYASERQEEPHLKVSSFLFCCLLLVFGKVGDPSREQKPALLALRSFGTSFPSAWIFQVQVPPKSKFLLEHLLCI